MGSSSTEHTTPPGAPIIIVTEGNQESPESTEQTPQSTANYLVHEKAQKSPSPGQESTIVASSVQKTIPYKLWITLEGSQDSKLVKDLSVILHNSESYQEIEKVAEGYATAFFAQTIGERELKFSYGNCIVVSNNGNKNRLPLRSQETWAVLHNSVVEYLISHSNEQLQFCISRHYLACQDQPSEGESFADLKYDEIDNLMKQGWENKTYIPHNILGSVFSDQTVYWIIKENPPKSVLRDDQDAFISRVQAEARILLAMCVRACLGTECLWVLLERGYKDSSLPSDDKAYCHRHPSCKVNYERLVQRRGSFGAAHFVQGEHKTLDPHTVVPLRFYPRARGNEDLDWEVAEVYDNGLQAPPVEKRISKNDAWRGAGANSNVYCVKVDPNHHSLSRVCKTSVVGRRD